VHIWFVWCKKAFWIFPGCSCCNMMSKHELKLVCLGEVHEHWAPTIQDSGDLNSLKNGWHPLPIKWTYNIIARRGSREPFADHAMLAHIESGCSSDNF
jgi:hypothetical protein